MTKKIVLITGASRGIGAATARCPSKRGYAVCLNYRTDDVSVDQVYQSLLANGVDVMKFRADVSIEAVKRMALRNGGSGGAIVNVSSAASRPGPAGEYVDYAASKGAIDTFTKGLANEVPAEGMCENCVRSGVIEMTIHADGGEPDRIRRVSPLIPMERGGSTEEVALTIAWLLSDEASYVTGSFTDVSGGR